MSLHVDDPGFAALRARSVHPLASREAIAQRDRERIAAGMPPTVAERRGAIDRIVAEVAKLPVLDPRSPDEIVGYDDDGLPA
jgi:hypothetical protein